MTTLTKTQQLKVEKLCRIGLAAHNFLTLEDALNEATGARAGDLAIRCMAARHDLRLVADFPCGCDEGTCPGLIG